MVHRAIDTSRGAYLRLRRPTRPDDTEAVSDLLQRARRILRAKLTALTAEHPRAEFVGGAFDSADGADRDGEGGPGADRVAAAERARALVVLELAPGATLDEVRSSYLKLCRKYHPDRFANDDARSSAAHELFVEISRAYELLMDSGSRA